MKNKFKFGFCEVAILFVLVGIPLLSYFAPLPQNIREYMGVLFR
jgi:hypothetical protein